MPTLTNHHNGIIAEFSEQELEIYRLAAMGRCLPKRAMGISNDGLVAKHLAGVDNDLLGILGEAAVGAVLGIRADLESHLGGDGGVTDLEYRGYTIQVKSSWHWNGGLLFTKVADFKADIGVLAVIDKTLDGFIRIAGWIPRRKFAEKAQYRDLGLGKCAYMYQNDLYPIGSLRPYIEF